ncbi:EAL domain-containing protein [Dyella sp. A6]|uniref:EAL domain-containing protein n=1 Tax=Dyella aluminiiresistens TaxID=3069105 RepID=UPI002E7890EA|nr:EAL domain-containing protein [Dyella sp. A6]
MPNHVSTGTGLRSRFYQSMAEALVLLHTNQGCDRQLALSEVVSIFATSMKLPLAWIGRRAPGAETITVLAAAGHAIPHSERLLPGMDLPMRHPDDPASQALRSGGMHVARWNAAAPAPAGQGAWHDGFDCCMTAAAIAHDGGQLVLAACMDDVPDDTLQELGAWLQRLVTELARFWDHQAAMAREQRISRYRDAQRAIQRALLEQPDPESVYHTLAKSLVDVAGAAAVDVFMVEADGTSLRRVALAGPIADDLGRMLPAVPAQGERMPLPLWALRDGRPQVRVRPSQHSGMSPAWQYGLLKGMGASGCWPIPAPDRLPGQNSTPLGVFALITPEEDAFDENMCRVLDELAEVAGLALRQHERRRAQAEEQQRQTYLALHDALTGLPNRRALDMQLERALERAERNRQLVVVGMLDLDDLKPINDRHGHVVGDLLLIEVARRLRGALRPDDYVARLGGDEFVIICEGLYDDAEIKPLLDHLWTALREPMHVEGTVFELTASLGIALYPEHASGGSQQLLRQADQAMYQVKAHKRQRERWWSMPLIAQSQPPEDNAYNGHGLLPYGELAESLLQPWSSLAEPMVPELVDAFIDGLRSHEGIGNLLTALSKRDRVVLAERLTQHVRLLLLPNLEIESHRMHAARAGRFHASAGLEEVWLLEGVELLRDLMAQQLGSLSVIDRRPLDIVLQRLGAERQWQLESVRELQRERVALLARLNALAWSADGYLELIQGVVDMLAEHGEICSCIVARPDKNGQLTYEAVGGEAFAQYLQIVARGEAEPIRVNADSPLGGGPSGRAWRTGQIQRCMHYATDPAMASWRDEALGIGIVSSVAIPLCPMPPNPSAVLTIYSPYAGGLQSEDQQAFVDQLKNLLDLALARLMPPRPGTELLPFIVRERWRGLIATDALQAYYQPVVHLVDGRVSELEALARLVDQDGTVLAPSRFLPALSDDDLVVLFRQMLSAATRQRETLLRSGHRLDVSVNTPAAALVDSRYTETAAAMIAEGHCPVDALLLEILESPMGTDHSAAPRMAGMQALKALGVRLVEDDLGAGYSSLIRLRHWPFDRIKIDQAIVMQAADDPLRTLRFIRQLIRLGHDLDLEVVVEGLETPGLIEAALSLGADMGQGYAFARPMPATELPGWLDAFRWELDPARPTTALGALASALLWEEQLLALPSGPAFWHHHAEGRCATGRYLESALAANPDLQAVHDAHAAMHEAALAGPLDPRYRQQRGRFLQLLIQQVRIEERGFATSRKPGPAAEA